MTGQAGGPGGGLDTRYEQLRHAALHARAEAFPLGFAVLTHRGVTAWRHALTALAPVPRPPTPVSSPHLSCGTTAALPARIGAELVNALTAVALAGT